MTLASAAINSFPLEGELWTSETSLPAGDHLRRKAWLMAQDPTNMCRIEKIWRDGGTEGIIYLTYKIFKAGGGYMDGAQGDGAEPVKLGDFLETWTRV